MSSERALNGAIARRASAVEAGADLTGFSLRCTFRRVARARHQVPAVLAAAVLIVGSVAPACASDPKSWVVELGVRSPGGLAVHENGSITVALADGDGAESEVYRLGDDGEEIAKRTTMPGRIWAVAAGERDEVLVTGSHDLEDGAGEAFVAKVDADGDIVWTTTLGAQDRYWSGEHLVVDEDAVWVVGSESWTPENSVPNPVGVRRPFVARLDRLGRVDWKQTLGEGEGNIYALALAPDPKGGIIVGVRLNTANLEIAGPRYEWANVATLLIGFDPDGAVRWSTDIGETDSDEMGSLGSLVASSEGALYSAGTRARHDLGNVTANNIFLTAASRDGDTLWSRSYTEGHQMDEPTLSANPCGGFVLSTHYSDGPSTGMLLIDVDASGAETRRRRFPAGAEPSYAYAWRVASHGCNDLVMLGDFQGRFELGPLLLETSNSYGAFVARLVD